MSTIASTCSMSTGHCSTQAPHVVQDHSTSSSMTASGPCGLYAPSGCVDVVARVARPAAPRPAALVSSGSAVAVVLGGQQPRRLGVRVVAQRHDQQLGGQRLVGVPGGALRLAAAALGAGGEVEQALPGEVLDLADAERGVLVEVLDVLEVDRLAADRDRLQRAERGAAVGVPLEADVEEGEEPVPGHAHRRLQRDGDHPRERDEDLDRRDDDDDGPRAAPTDRPAKTLPIQPVSGKCSAVSWPVAGRPGQGGLEAAQQARCRG